MYPSLTILDPFLALKLLAEPKNVPALINCAHGKDRTGMISAMVLGCLGKSNEYIAYDYAKSEVCTYLISGLSI
jgi:protein tyrosine/serine phosphatase